jgi:hypothetical protein
VLSIVMLGGCFHGLFLPTVLPGASILEKSPRIRRWRGALLLRAGPAGTRVSTNTFVLYRVRTHPRLEDIYHVPGDRSLIGGFRRRLRLPADCGPLTKNYARHSDRFDDQKIGRYI